MWSSPVLFAAVFGSTVLAQDKSSFCIKGADGIRLCSPLKIPNGNVFSELLESMMAVSVDRTGLKRLNATKFDEPLPLAEGPYRPNRKLDDNTELKFEFLTGPESISKVDNFLYAATENAIYRVDLSNGDSKIVYNGNEKCPTGKSCSRPLGIRIKGNRLLCADAFQGLIEVDLTTGESKVHLSVGTLVNGTPLVFPDDLDVDWEEEIVYMSDGSTKWGLDDWLLTVIELEASSRVIRFDLKTGRAGVFAQNLRFGNGVQMTFDKKSLLVSEFSTRRILKFALDDPPPASAKPFTSLLPGNPDNIRPSLTGTYWVACPLARANGSRTLVDELQARPDLAEKYGNSALTFGSLMESMGTVLSNDALHALGREVKSGLSAPFLEALPRDGLLLELDTGGNILQSLQSTQIGRLTEVLEHEGGLYCGSFANKFILSVPRANFRSP